MKQLDVLSTFTGAGFLDIPFFKKNKLFKVVGFSEIDKHCISVLRYHHPKVINYGSVTELLKKELSKFDVLIGGSPCQSMSICGKQEGLKGKSRLLLDFIKIFQKHSPNYIVWENVFNALSIDEGWIFFRLQVELAKAGYVFIWQVLDARYFGTPQARNRVFLLAVNRRVKSAEQVFEKRKIKDNARVIENGRQKGKASTNFGKVEVISDNKNNKLIAYSKSTRGKFIDHRLRYDNSLNTLLCSEGGISQSSGNYVVNNENVRRLTVNECEQLMGLSIDYTKYGINESGNKIEIPETARYSMIGNGVVYKCVNPFIKLIEEIEDAEENRSNIQT